MKHNGRTNKIILLIAYLIYVSFNTACLSFAMKRSTGVTYVVVCCQFVIDSAIHVIAQTFTINGKIGLLRFKIDTNNEFEQIRQHLISGSAGKLAEYIFTREATKLSIKNSPREHRAGKHSYLKTLPFQIYCIGSVSLC